MNPALLNPSLTEQQQMAVVMVVGHPYPLDHQCIEWVMSPTFARHRAVLSIDGPDKEALHAVKQEVVDLDRQVYKKGAITVDDCEQYLLLLSKHLLTHRGDGRVGRWLVNPFIQVGTVDNINKVLEAVATGDTTDLGWRAPMRAGWACLNGGFFDHALAIWTWLREVEAAGEGVAKRVFPDVCGHHRFRLSVYNGLAATLRARGDIQAELEVRARIRELWEPIHYWVGRNRIVESAVEAYRVDPTQERREEALRLFVMLRGAMCGSVTEGVRESLVVAWMLYRYILVPTGGSSGVG